METNSHNSCISGDPLILFGDGNSQELKLNLPQSTCLSPKASIPFAIEDHYFKTETKNIPENNFWEETKALDDRSILDRMKSEIEAGDLRSGLIGNIQDVVRSLKGKVTQTIELPRGSKEEGVAFLKSSYVGNNNEPKAISKVAEGIDLTHLKNKIKLGFKPLIYTSLSGKPIVCYKPKPVAPKPTLFIIEEYKVCSYLGKYGAGKTVETFSLLPGEKTTITIKTYKEIESKNIVAENFLDSFSTHSAEQLERLVEAESGTSSSNSTQVGASFGSNMQVGGSLSGVSANATTTFNSAFNIATQREANTRLLNSVISTSVREANSNREISISSANESRSLESEENTTVRELQNINYSRVLNFVFRQLSQEYLVITSLDNIKIMYTNGYPESTRIVDLPQLEGLLNEVIEPGFVDTVLSNIVNEYCKVYNYQDSPLSFIEKVTLNKDDCETQTPLGTLSFWRKNKTLVDIYDNIEVNGVILDVKKHILKTPTVIADALLGQGEALDCYNQKLQDAAASKALLELEELTIAKENALIENQNLQQEINLRQSKLQEEIDLITVERNKLQEEILIKQSEFNLKKDIIEALLNIDPAQAAALYHKVFTPCCDTPQCECHSRSIIRQDVLPLNT